MLSEMESKRGVLSLVVCGLILISGCQDDQGVNPQPESEANSVQSEKLKQEMRLEFERCLKAAESGDAMEQSNLGVLYANGVGVEQDPFKAMEWYRKAAKQDNPIAQYHIGSMYLNGKGVKQDHKQAIEWFRKTAEQGETDAQY